jgi:hypothetical protein
MKNVIRRVMIPTLVTLLFFQVVDLPVHVLGCRNRGLLAFAIALSSVLTSLIVMIFACVKRARHNAPVGWSMLSSLIFAIPALYIFALTLN